MIKREAVPVDRADEAAVRQAADHLCALELELKSSDTRTFFEPATSKLPPRLQVQNVHVPHLSEVIVACPQKDSVAWFFWFSWGDAICLATELKVAAQRITDLLAAEESSG